MLAAILRDSVDEFIRLSPGIGEDDERDSSEAEPLREEVQKVRDRLYDTPPAAEIRPKRSSKAPSFTDIDWDIKTKHFDAKFREFRTVSLRDLPAVFPKRIRRYPLHYLWRESL